MSKVQKQRSKLGYLNYSEIESKIQNNELDAYDIIFTKDTHENVIISEDLKIIPIKSKVLRFDDIEAAEKYLNSDESSYEGQIVSIKDEEIYVGYIVNKDYRNQFYVTPLSQSSSEINYNTLGNRPIINLIGTLDDIIIVDELENGTYAIKGEYKISQKEETLYSSAVFNLFLIEHEVDNIYIKKISARDITDYIIADTITTSVIPTTEYLKDQGYVTSEYIDNRLSALDYMTRAEVETYVSEVVLNTIDDILDERIDKKLDEREISDEQVTGLFTA